MPQRDRARITIACEVRDHGGGISMLLRPRLPAGDIPGGRGLWLAQQLTQDSWSPLGPQASVSACPGVHQLDTCGEDRHVVAP